ncbi:hypothetical protein FRC10_008969 [Ceratobasidium sp. 414]|nr:hypothetical protein FRC10_008969 [Ceratobasidium sp. 414]
MTSSSVFLTSRISVRVYENGAWKRSRIGSVEYAVSDVAGRLNMSLECDTQRFTVTLSLSDTEPDMEVVVDSMEELEATERHKRVLKRTVPVKGAIAAILETVKSVAGYR